MKHIKTFESFNISSDEELNEGWLGLGLSKEDKQLKADLEKGPLSPEVYNELVELGKKDIRTDAAESKLYNETMKRLGAVGAKKFAVFIALKNKKIIDAGKYSAWNEEAIAPDGSKGFFGNGSKFGDTGANQ
jgi:hypothetical protein